MGRNKRHHPPFLARLLLKKMTAWQEIHSVFDDFEETFHEIANRGGRMKAAAWYWRDVLKSVPPYAGRILTWRLIMFKNYLKMAYRQFTQNRLFSLINVFGLAVGLTVCTLISLWIFHEMSYDRFHEKSHRVFRIERELFRDNYYSRWPITAGGYHQALMEDYPEIENATRVWRRQYTCFDHHEQKHTQGLFAVDNAFFDIFDFPLLAGDPSSALSEPFSMVLTRELARKYFGTEDAVGKALSFEAGDEILDLHVTGILEPVPENSHIQFDMLMSINTFPNERFAGWRGNYLYTYVLLKEGVDARVFEPKLKEFVANRLEAHYGDLTGQGLPIHDVLKMHLFPITGIHLDPSLNYELEIGGSQTAVYILGSIAVLILIIAAINFINLSTARAGKRAREVSLRKTVGAGRYQLRSQFIQESMLLVFAALLLSLGLDLFLIPFLERSLDATLSLSLLFSLPGLGILTAAAMAVGFFAGLYPAFYLTRFDPVMILRGNPASRDGKSSFRRNLVIIQFVITIALMVGMFTVHRQMNFIKNCSLGYDKEGLVTIPVRSRSVMEGFEAFRNTVLQESRIVNVATSTDIPGEDYYSNSGFHKRQDPDENINLMILQTDFNFIETYGMGMAAGRNFSREFADTAGTLILNEAAVRRIGWSPEEAIGQEMTFFGRFIGRVVGVVEDFHLKSLHNKVEPLTLILDSGYFRKISVRIAPGHLGETVGLIQEKWEETFPGESFQFTFMDDQLRQLYDLETKMQTLFFVFSCFSVFVACLGILGLSAFTAEARTKEIGIRKTLGASTAGVTLLLSKSFIKWILVANAGAWPLAWFIMNQWLRDFAYRVELGWGVFVWASLLTLAVALATFGFQTLKAARSRPVDTLRYE